MKVYFSRAGYTCIYISYSPESNALGHRDLSLFLALKGRNIIFKLNITIRIIFDNDCGISTVKSYLLSVNPVKY